MNEFLIVLLVSRLSNRHETDRIVSAKAGPMTHFEACAPRPPSLTREKLQVEPDRTLVKHFNQRLQSRA